MQDEKDTDTVRSQYRKPLLVARIPVQFKQMTSTSPAPLWTKSQGAALTIPLLMGWPQRAHRDQLIFHQVLRSQDEQHFSYITKKI